MKTMTNIERLLALDAAACAAECAQVPASLRNAIDKLQSELETYFENSDETPTVFGDFLIEQQNAVLSLAESPEAFGGEHDIHLEAAIDLAREIVIGAA